jgi:hypothetical protein
MRTSIFAIMVVAGSTIAFPATAQQQPGERQAAPSEQSGQQTLQDADKGSRQASKPASRCNVTPTKASKPATPESPDAWPTKTSPALQLTLRADRKARPRVRPARRGLRKPTTSLANDRLRAQTDAAINLIPAARLI